MVGLELVRPLRLVGANQSEVGAKGVGWEGKERKQGSAQPPRIAASQK